VGKVRTVLGEVDAKLIGAAMIHEHVLFDIVSPSATGDLNARIELQDRWQIDNRSNENPANAHQKDPEVATAELKAFATDGGSLVVDQSVIGLARDPTGLAYASGCSGVHLVAATGTYTAPFLDPVILEMNETALADLFIKEITEGIGSTIVRAGLIGEIGCSWPIEPIERRALVAAAIAQITTGAAISVHPGRHHKACSNILDILEQAGADLSRVILSHMDRTHPKGTGIEHLLARKANVEWDFFGIEQSHYWMGLVELPTDLERLRLIRKFADLGYAGQILISQDICTKTRLQRWGGHGYGHILRNVQPLMDRLGFPDRLQTALLRDNPLRLITLKE
jgi:phosphotriesterase-related protein